MAILIIGETKETKEKVYREYLWVLSKFPINSFPRLSLDLKNADYNIDLNNPKSIRKNFMKIPHVDCIILNNILEHVLNIDLLFRMCLFVLKPKGYLIIRTDNALYFPFFIPIAFRPLGIGYHAGQYQKLYHSHPKDNHYHIFTKWHLLVIAKKYHLRVLDLSFGVYKYGIKNVDIPLIKYFMPRMMVILQKS